MCLWYKILIRVIAQNCKNIDTYIYKVGICVAWIFKKVI